MSGLSADDALELDHAEVERRSTAFGTEFMRSLIQDHMDLRAEREKTTVEPMRGADSEETEVRPSQRDLGTLHGTVVVHRLALVKQGVSGGLRPLDAQLNLPDGLYSQGVQREVVWGVAQASYDAVIENLRRTTGTRIAKHQAEELVGKVTVDFQDFYLDERRGSLGLQPLAPVVHPLRADPDSLAVRGQRQAAAPKRREVCARLVHAPAVRPSAHISPPPAEVTRRHAGRQMGEMTGLRYSGPSLEAHLLAGRRLPFQNIVVFGAFTAGRSAAWAAIVLVAYLLLKFEWLRMPFLPLSVMGIAVSFYVGFKNNAAYDRFWEGRKIWGAVVNASRSWASGVLCYVLPGDTGDEANTIRRTLVLRHLAWVNALRLQLRQTSRLFDKPSRGTRIRLEKHAVHMRNDWDTEMAPFLSPEELTAVSARANPATHIVHQQGVDLMGMFREQRIDLFHQIALMDILQELYTLQGQCERIKKTPFPRQYAEFSRIFTRAFVLFVPFGLLDVFADRMPSVLSTPAQAVWVVPYLVSAAVIGWVFFTMEGVGDASEDPFERSMNDVPMNALCRAIERDLRQMLGDEQIPDVEHPIDGLLY